MKTRQDLIERTLDLLNVIAAGQSPEAEDVQQIDKLIDGKIAELNARDIYYTSDTTQFEDQYLDALATIIGDMAAPDFGQARNEERVLAAVNRIREMKPSTYVPGSTLQVDYF
ncbi:hypothetical protein QTA58_00230 [Neorhizobium sp. CSC1952]|uniref:hypothetical protein n=1 Tax=Neorhizobium sp. CSC1952 TaxID=2978974 RepID=UPI0025A66B9A|nr:hypothetical protein [Rhizobium sp. CSC1952]WJR67236.1 hypothetical protein QTA58_00230 [Rhizobium sp. CSC1952]